MSNHLLKMEKASSAALRMAWAMNQEWDGDEPWTGVTWPERGMYGYGVQMGTLYVIPVESADGGLGGYYSSVFGGDHMGNPRFNLTTRYTDALYCAQAQLESVAKIYRDLRKLMGEVETRIAVVHAISRKHSMVTKVAGGPSETTSIRVETACGLQMERDPSPNDLESTCYECSEKSFLSILEGA